jgi:hypothetical protein
LTASDVFHLLFSVFRDRSGPILELGILANKVNWSLDR